MQVFCNTATQALKLCGQHIARHGNKHAILIIVGACSVLNFQLRVIQLVDIDA
jgi:hypothetical protein